MGRLHDRMAQDLVLRNLRPATARDHLVSSRRFAAKSLHSGDSDGTSRLPSAPQRLDHALASPPHAAPEHHDLARRQKMSRAR
jgi:hypothetical protein